MSKSTYSKFISFAAFSSGNLSYANTLHPKPFIMFINTFPIFPEPITPTVLPCISNPNSPFKVKLYFFVLWYALYIFLSILKSNATACSATAYGEYAGTLTTFSFSPIFFISTLLNPAHLKAINFTPSSSKILIVFSSTTSFTNIHTTSNPFASGAVSLFNLDSKYVIS